MKKYYILKFKYFYIGKVFRFLEESEDVSLIGSLVCFIYNIVFKLYVFLLK